MLSERSQTQRLYTVWLHLYEILKKKKKRGKTIKTKSMVASGTGKRTDSKRTAFLGEWWKCTISWLWWYLYNYTFVKTHWTVHFKWMNFIICKLYFKKLKFKSKCRLWSIDNSPYSLGHFGWEKKYGIKWQFLFC